MVTSRKAAPRQKVERIDKVGPWGRTEYHHVLACGHTEVRKRVSRSSEIACLGCVLAENHVAAITALKEPAQKTATESEADWVDYDAEQVELELVVGRMKAKTAKLLQVNLDDIEVWFDPGAPSQVTIQGMIIHLTQDSIKYLGDT